MKLITFVNAKTIKGENNGYLTGIVYLAPSNELYLYTKDEKYKSFNACPKASKGCRQACLFTAGRGRFDNVKHARVERTKLFVDNQDAFMQMLYFEIKATIRKAERKGMKLAIRLNGTSDIQWENIKLDGKNMFQHFPEVQFYDYTKDYSRNFKELPKNYHATFSRSETNEKKIPKDVNVAVVFNKLPETWNGKKVINGDETDLRFLDEQNVIVGLTAKGKAKKDQSNFVIEV